MLNNNTTPYFSILFAFLISFTLFAQEGNSVQQRKIDSLTTLLQKQTSPDTTTVNQMKDLANLLVRVSQLDSAISYAEKSKKLAQKLNFKNGEVDAFQLIGIASVFKGDYTKALENYHSSLRIIEKIGDKWGIANTYNHIGIAHLYQGNYPEALENYFKSLKLFEELEYKKGILNSLNNIGIVYKNQEKYAKALENYHLTLKMYQEIEDKQGIGMAYNNIGNIYQLQGKYPEALENHLAALKIKKELGNKQEMAGSYNNIGVIYKEQGKYAEALANYFTYLQLSQEIGDKSGIAQAQTNIGLVELRLNHPESAKRYNEKALSLAKEIGMKTLLKDIYYNTTQVDSTLGKFKDAFENYKQYIVYRDSLNNEETEKKSLKASMGYEYDKKAAVIQAELKTKNLERNVAFAGFGVMGFLTILTIYFFKLRGKKLKVEKQNLELQRKEVEIIKENEQFKTRFLANISHEFRTPLTLINGHVEVLKESGRQEDFVHFNEIEHNGKRLLTLINQLLDLSKMESGQYKLEYKRGNVINETSMLVQSFHSYAEQHGIALLLQQTEEAKYLAEHPFTYSSEALAIIMTNLISNAIKYTPAGGSVTAHIDYVDSKMRVSIADTGEGIAVEHLPKIFERFYQVDEPGKRTYAGSGIGLALVKELTILHGGDITVESPIEGGCIFTFWIESAATEDIEDTAAVEHNTIFPAKTATEDTTRDAQDENPELPLLLIIEDQPELRSFIVQNLGSQYRYEEASNGTDGIRLANELLPDLIISDVMMPDTDGLELCETLKNNIATSHIPIMLLTAKAEQKDKLIGLETGADDYLTKPFSLQELKLRVKNILAFKALLRKKFNGNNLPTAEETPELNSRDRKFVDDVTVMVETNISNPQFSVNTLAEGIFLSVSQLTRKLKTITGKTPADYIRNIRLEKACALLKNGGSVADVAWAVGFEDAVYFSKVFKKHFGFSPSSVKNK